MKKILTTPICQEDLLDLKTGDVVYLTGLLVTGRDSVHRRVVEGGQELPADIRGGAIFHAGPIVRKREGTQDRYDMVAVGPTTSMRMERFEKEFIEKTGLRLIVGKGGMGPRTEEACREHKVIHCVFPAGCAVSAAQTVEEIEAVHWLDLGMPEAVWVCRVKEFGPLIVSIDAQGNSLFRQNQAAFEQRKEAALKALYPLVNFID